MLKVVVQSQNATPTENSEAGGKENYVFQFTSGSNARVEADSIKEALSTAIQAAKTAPTPTPTPANGPGTPAAMAIANALSATAGKQPSWDDDNRLKSDIELHQSLLRSDPALKKVFTESLRTKADTVTGTQFMSQFWSTRIPLLRAHAIERAQTRGSYNVLSSIKPRVEDNVTKLNISKEQIQLIFSQHPLVKKVYDENVPKLSEQQFWSRFFQSRLFKKLRGERVTDADATDSVLDKYLRHDDNTSDSVDTQIPHMIDLQGNEENHSQRQGNRPDIDMRPSSVDKVPIIRTLNSLSEKIMANVTPIDAPRNAPIGMDEDTFNELQLRDLQGDQELNRVILNIRDQSRFFSEAKPTDSQEVQTFTHQSPDEILSALQVDLGKTFPEGDQAGVPLSQIVEPEDDDSDEEDNKNKKEPVGSRAGIASATSQVLQAVRERKAQAESASSSGTCGLSTPIFDRLTLTHATTTEFLNQFWKAFLSGNPERADEIKSLVESLNRAMDRIKAVADEAENEKMAEVEKRRQHARDISVTTGRTSRPNLKGLTGGAEVVNQLMGPTTKALGKATDEYKKALATATAVSATGDGKEGTPSVSF